jgi:RHS repeat-associated protein
LAKVSFGIEGEVVESTIEYAYDDADRLVGVKDSASGEYVLDYDELDRLTEISGPEGTVGYSYDDAGRRATMSLPGQEPLGYEYDDANRLTGLARGLEAVSLAYDGAGRLSAASLPNGIEQVYDRDEAGQVTSIAYKDGEETLGDLHYGYNADGRTRAIWGDYARLDLPEALESAEYNAANELVERDEEELSYDAEGNLVDDGESEYQWDARGQLSEITGANSASFAYDPFARRTSKTVGATTTGYLHDGDNVAQEYSGEELTASLLTGLGLDQLFSRISGEGLQSYLTDRLGSVIALANASKELETTYSYEPFGAPTSAGEPSENPFQFTGRESDGTGLQYNRARYYSPGLARFISQDPAGFAGSGTNLYWYANGDPLDFTDPSGEISINPGAWAGGIRESLEDTAGGIGRWVSDAPGVLSDVGGYLLTNGPNLALGCLAGGAGAVGLLNVYSGGAVWIPGIGWVTQGGAAIGGCAIGAISTGATGVNPVRTR